MTPAEIRTFVTSQIEPLPDSHYGPRYRCAVTLTDGLYLPCVVVSGIDQLLALASRRLREAAVADRPNPLSRLASHLPGPEYLSILSSFVADRNRINSYDIASLSPSPYAFPLARLREIGGETRMGWTAFSGVFQDGSRAAFGTSYNVEFFELPEDQDIASLVAIEGERPDLAPVYKARPFFTCHIPGF